METKGFCFSKKETLKRFIPVTDGDWTPVAWAADDGTVVDWEADDETLGDWALV